MMKNFSFVCFENTRHYLEHRYMTTQALCLLPFYISLTLLSQMKNQLLAFSAQGPEHDTAFHLLVPFP